MSNPFDENTTLKKKRGKRSWVWEYFEKHDNNTICLVCSKKISWNNISTNQLAWHINSHHNIFGSSNKKRKLDWVNLDDSNEESIDKENLDPNPNSSKKKATINTKLVDFIVGSNLPVSIVENKLFADFVKSLIGNEYSLPCRGVVTHSLIPEMVNIL